MAKKPQATHLEIQEIEAAECTFHVLGTSPLIMNRFSQKAWQELMFPSERRSLAALEQSLKHDPVQEFRGAVYRNRDPKAGSLIHVPNGAFHGALAQVAVDIPGAARAKIERLTRVVDTNIELYGIPHLFCAMVRNSDMAHTPDVRTRPIFPEWACKLTIRWIKSALTERTIGNLFSAAGTIVGIGDWRGEKGGSYGAWVLVGPNDPTYTRIVKQQGRAAQGKALEQPIFYDPDTADIMTWFEGEVLRREKNLPSAPTPKGKRGVVMENGKGEVVTA